MASNAWVIHGNYTKSGLPLLASDPHLKNDIPATWILNELMWEDKYVIGGTAAGMPFVQIGRTESFAWGCSATRIDNSDIWEEEVNDDFTKYLVDGEWREIKKITEKIKVKGGDDIDFVIGFTHRGPLIELNLLKGGAEVLFLKGSPKVDNKAYYSVAFAGTYIPGDDNMKALSLFANAESVKKHFHALDEIGKDGFNGLNQNLIFADKYGDIAYYLTAPIPVRKDKTPYIGCRVLDGRRSEFDWEPGKLAPITELPRAINPKKGYILTANNR